MTGGDDVVFRTLKLMKVGLVGDDMAERIDKVVYTFLALTARPLDPYTPTRISPRTPIAD